MVRLIALLILLAAPAGQSAQKPGLAFSATLESIRIDARPGQVVTRQFRLTLDPGQPRTRFRAKVEDWWRSEDGRQSVYAPPGTLRRSCGPWVTLNPVESVVGPGDTLVIRLSIAVPGEIAAGGYWCVLTVDEISEAPPAASGVGVRFAASVSTGIFVSLHPIQRVAQILDLDVENERAVVRIRNGGNAPIGVEGRVEFFAPGAPAPRAVVTMPRTTILTEPTVDGVAAAALPPPAVLPSGPYRVRVILDYGADHYLGAERELTLARGATGHGGR